MTGQDMIDELHDHEFDDIEDTRLLALLNDKYQEICARYRWPFLQVIDSVHVYGGDNGQIVLPSDFAHHKGLYLSTDTSFSNNLIDNRDNFIETQDSPASNYLYMAKRFWEKDLNIVYYQFPEDLALNTSPIFPSRHHEAVVYGALARAYFMTDDSALGQIFIQQFEDRVGKMAADLLSTNMAPRLMIDVYAD